MFRKVLIKTLLFVLVLFSFGSTTQAATTYDAPSNSNFKSYMDYRTITCKASNQYKLQQLSVTNEDGLRMYDNRYCIALGTGFNVDVGDYVDVWLGDRMLECVVGDIKQDVHTGPDNKQIVHNGNVVEFIVEKDKLDEYVAKTGSIANIEGFDGDVTQVVVHDDMSPSYPDYTVVGKHSVTVGTTKLYILEYKLGDTTRSATIDEEAFSNYKVFESLYTNK